MFTGIIESQAVLLKRQAKPSQTRLTFRILGKSKPFRSGESIAVEGVCLTVAHFKGREFSADVIPETEKATTLGRLSTGRRVNIERSLKMGDPLGGHWVSGHVDGVGRIQAMERRGGGFRLKIKAPPSIIPFLVPKGSIALDGVSFTLQEVGKQFFTIGVTPHTYRMTSLQYKRAGDPINLEVDLFARLAHRFFSGRRVSSRSLGEFKRQGF